MKKLLATILALVMALGLCSVSWAAGTEKIVVHGIKYNNKDDNEFATFEAAYAALKPVFVIQTVGPMVWDRNPRSLRRRSSQCSQMWTVRETRPSRIRFPGM